MRREGEAEQAKERRAADAQGPPAPAGHDPVAAQEAPSAAGSSSSSAQAPVTAVAGRDGAQEAAAQLQGAWQGVPGLGLLPAEDDANDDDAGSVDGLEGFEDVLVRAYPGSGRVTAPGVGHQTYNCGT